LAVNLQHEGILGLEERLARLEGVAEQMDKRLASIEDRLNHVESRLNHMETRLEGLKRRSLRISGG